MPDPNKNKPTKQSPEPAFEEKDPPKGTPQPLTRQELKTKKQEARLAKKKANTIERKKRQQNRQEFRNWKKEVKGTPATYKTSMATYTLPGEGSRENYSEGTFRKDNRAMQAGLIVDGGFGDLSDSYKGTSESPTLRVPVEAVNAITPKGVDMSMLETGGPDITELEAKVDTDSGEAAATEGGNNVRGALKDAFANADNPDFTPTEQTWTDI